MYKSTKHPINPESLVSVIVVALTATTGMMHITLTPLIVGGFVDDLGFTPNFAGLITSAAVFGTAAGAILTSLNLTRLDPRNTVYSSLFIMLLLDGLSATASAEYTLLLLRFLSGVFGAVASSITLGSFAMLQQPSRGYGTYNIFFFGVAAAVFAAIPYAMQTLGVAAVFYTIMAFTLICLVSLRLTGLTGQSPQHKGDSQEPHTMESLQLLTTPRVILSLTMFFLVMMATGMWWTYFERLGIAAGHSLELIGLAMGSSSITGGLGALAAILIGSRSITAAAFTLGTLFYGIGVYQFTNPEISATIFYCAALIEGLGLSFLISIYQTLLASLDNKGRIAAFAVFVMAIGRAFGAMLAAFLVTDNPYTIVPWYALVLLIISFIGIRILLSRKASTFKVTQKSFEKEKVEDIIH